MRDFPSVAIAPSVVVGVDGSSAARNAALWAVDEAVSRDIPLRLLSVVNPADLCGGDADRIEFASARAALYEAQRFVEATGKPVKVETEIAVGKPLRELINQSRSAELVCVGSIGVKHAYRGVGSVAAGLPELSQCPVAVIRQPAQRPPNPKPRSIVVEADNGVVLRHAFEEARLRAAPLRAIASWRAEAPDDVGDESRLVQAYLNRRIEAWRRRYPDVDVEPVAVRGSICRYLAENASSIELFVSGSRSRVCELGRADNAGCSVLTVHQNHL
jgi:nucleotide-binding universal stress UspA family protein